MCWVGRLAGRLLQNTPHGVVVLWVHKFAGLQSTKVSFALNLNKLEVIKSRLDFLKNGFLLWELSSEKSALKKKFSFLFSK